MVVEAVGAAAQREAAFGQGERPLGGDDLPALGAQVRLAGGEEGEALASRRGLKVEDGGEGLAVALAQTSPPSLPAS